MIGDEIFCVRYRTFNDDTLFEFPLPTHEECDTETRTRRTDANLPPSHGLGRVGASLGANDYYVGLSASRSEKSSGIVKHGADALIPVYEFYKAAGQVGG